MISSIFILLFGVLLISLVVFGGAQMFIPYFRILLVNILKISDSDWDNVLSIANSTPGIFGLKLALASGYLAGQGEWWAYLLMIVSYLIFISVPLVIMYLVMKQYKKWKKSNFMDSLIKIMRPMIAGILVSVIINLAMSIIVPFVGFNDLSDDFGKLDKYFYLKNTFFREWRYWMLLAWSLLAIPIDFYILKKWKISAIILIIINIALCMILFEPWL